MIACFLGNISAKYYKNPSMLSRVIAKNVGDVFLDTVYIIYLINIIINRDGRWRHAFNSYHNYISPTVA